MSEAARQNAFWSYKPGYKLTPEESDAFDYGWRAAMRFMAQPRIPTPVRKEPDQVAERFVGESRMSIRLADGTIVPSPITEDDLKSEDFHNGVEAARALFGDTPKVDCPECGGTGVIDSGGFDQADRPINIGCPLCHGKPVTEAQVKAAGWVNANEKPQPKEHNPLGLVAFYTDAPTKPWGNTPGRVDHPKGCACGLCEQEDPDV